MDGNDSINSSWCDTPVRSDMVCQFNTNGGPSGGPSDGSSGISYCGDASGGYMCEGLLPFPERLAKKIVALECGDERPHARDMAEGGGGKCKKYVVPSSAEDCPCHQHPPVASVLCWNGWGPVAKVPTDGARVNGLSGAAEISRAWRGLSMTGPIGGRLLRLKTSVGPDSTQHCLVCALRGKPGRISLVPTA